MLAIAPYKPMHPRERELGGSISERPKRQIRHPSLHLYLIPTYIRCIRSRHSACRFLIFQRFFHVPLDRVWPVLVGNHLCRKLTAQLLSRATFRVVSSGGKSSRRRLRCNHFLSVEQAQSGRQQKNERCVHKK